MKKRNFFESGFTLVELLIVIALIAILSVAVLATINPIEQSNKAKDATVQNDAAEVMNALERYYTVKNTYPWMDSDSSTTISSYDIAWFGTSKMIGAGLCGVSAASAGPITPCTTYKTRGALISTDELKDSFLAKGYTSLIAADPNYNAAGMNLLWINKTPATEGNSVYVCFIPKAKSNRTRLSNLYVPTVDAGGNVTTLTLAPPGEFLADGSPVATRTFATPGTSLFKCVP